MAVRASRLMVAGTASGCGKTTVACGLMRALVRRGLCVAACKCGPDYLDPTYHERVVGTPSRNLDLFLGDAELARSLVAQGAQTADVTVIEGVMGYYDGIAQSAEASSYDVARVTKTPVVLVVDARGRALSVAAEVAGFVRFREPSQVAGVILNRVSAGYYPCLKEAVERETGISVLGFVPQVEEARLESRHLGLVAASEVDDLRERVDRLAEVLGRTLDFEGLLGVAASAPALEVCKQELVERASALDVSAQELGLRREGDTCVGSSAVAAEGPVIAVARDEAFCFYYADALACLERLGVRLAYFSPIRDAHLPEGACGLMLGGGYPELHAAELAANEQMRAEVRAAIEGGVPTIAECGGFMYLHRTLEDAEGVAWPMAGVLEARAFGRGRLGRFGYVTLEAHGDGLLTSAGDKLRAHEFHYWDSDAPGDGFVARKPRSDVAWDCVVSTPTLYAGFPHLYLAGNPRAAARFVDACAAYGRARQRDAQGNAYASYGYERWQADACGDTRGNQRGEA